MTLKQLETKTKNAKMAGQDKRHFLNRNARHLKKPFGDIAGLTKLGFHSIGIEKFELVIQITTNGRSGFLSRYLTPGTVRMKIGQSPLKLWCNILRQKEMLLLMLNVMK